ncbi:MAG: WYL domain-containing protein [Eubacterium sp.]|nr:WYL domain-containing protein [Eubacterium sp.]
MLLDYKGNKGFRLLNIYERLNKGETVTKEALANDFGVSLKTIQRDIDDLRAYLAEAHFMEYDTCIKYSKAKNGYYLVRQEREWFTNEEVLALCKILLESRAFCKEEMSNIINKVLMQSAPNDRKRIEDIIRCEFHSYIPLQHGKPLMNILWKISDIIRSQKVIRFKYERQDKKIKQKEGKPVAIMFSEFYFYMIAFMTDDIKNIPIVFRVDRIKDIEETGETFQIPYRDKFNDGEFRKRVQFMYSGELKTVVFKYSGVLEAILDRLPTAKILNEDNGTYTISAETYGNGIYMWLRSQGDLVEIL